MLMLYRKFRDRVRIGPPEKPIWVTIYHIRGCGNQATVTLGIEAPDDVQIMREEVLDEIRGQRTHLGKAWDEAGRFSEGIIDEGEE